LAEPQNKDHVSCLGVGEPGIFSVLEPRGKLGIFLSPRNMKKYCKIIMKKYEENLKNYEYEGNMQSYEEK